MEHLRKFALEPLRTALVEDMTAFEPAADATSQSPHNSESVAPRRHVTTRRQRAFKIFISLLDKWEIGAPLTEVAVMDAFAAVEAISKAPQSSSEEVRAALHLGARERQRADIKIIADHSDSAAPVRRVGPDAPVAPNPPIRPE